MDMIENVSQPIKFLKINILFNLKIYIYMQLFSADAMIFSKKK